MRESKKKTKPAKAAKPKPKPRDPEAVAARRRLVFNLLGIIVLVGALGVGFRFADRYVSRDVAFDPQPPAVVLVNRPAWMTDFLARQIKQAIRPQGGHSALSRQMPKNVVDALREDTRISPWIAKVNQVRLAYGQKPGDTLEVDCEYRVPVALVRWQDGYYLVDGNGVLLPERYTADQLNQIVFVQDGLVNIRVVQGVQSPKPTRPGLKWRGADLAAGLDMVKVLHGLTYAREITGVDVSNFRERRKAAAAQIVLLTRYNTRIRWGRPISNEEKDFLIEIPPAEKLKHLKDIYQQYGRVDAGHPWLDLRFRQVTYPTDAQADSR